MSIASWFVEHSLASPAATLAAAILGALVAASTIAVQLRAARKTTKTAEDSQRDRITIAIATDIASIVDIFESSGLITDFSRRYRNSGEAVFPFAAAPRSEDYFALFHALAPEIGRLDSTDRVRRAVEFYHFLKASRDAAVPLGNAATSGPSAERDMVVRNVLILLDRVLAAASGFFEAATEHAGLNAEILAIYSERIQRFIPRAREEIQRALVPAGAGGP